MDSAIPPLDVHRLHADRHRQLRRDRHGAERDDVGDLLAAAPARAAPVYRPVHVRIAVSRQVAPIQDLTMKTQAKVAGKAASKLIDDIITGLGDWRGETLAKMRALIIETDSEVLEEVKWMGTPVWSHDGGICTGETYKSIVKLTFFKGAALKDPAKLFNSSLDGNVRRAIDIHEGDEIDANAFKALIRAAVDLNTSGGKK